MQWRAVIQLDVVKRVGEDLRHPGQSLLNAAKEEEMNRPEQQSADADREPDPADLVDALPQRRCRFEDAEQRRVNVEQQR